MRQKSWWDIPYVVCFLIGLVVVLIGIAATTYHVIGWVQTNHWHSTTDGEMLTSWGYGDSRTGWGPLQGLADTLWNAPFWAVTLALGVAIIYLPSLLRAIFGRRR